MLYISVIPTTHFVPVVQSVSNDAAHPQSSESVPPLPDVKVQPTESKQSPADEPSAVKPDETKPAPGGKTATGSPIQEGPVVPDVVPDGAQITVEESKPVADEKKEKEFEPMLEPEKQTPQHDGVNKEDSGTEKSGKTEVNDERRNHEAAEGDTGKGDTGKEDKPDERQNHEIVENEDKEPVTPTESQ